MPAHWIRDLFVAQTNSDPTLGTQAIRIFKLLRNCGFNDCIHVKTKEAVAYYDRRGIFLNKYCFYYNITLFKNNNLPDPVFLLKFISSQT